MTRLKIGSYAETIYEKYQTVTTNSLGKYSYLIKVDNCKYKICCRRTNIYKIIGISFTEVDNSIIDSKTILNNINFILTTK